MGVGVPGLFVPLLETVRTRESLIIHQEGKVLCSTEFTRVADLSDTDSGCLSRYSPALACPSLHVVR